MAIEIMAPPVASPTSRNAARRWLQEAHQFLEAASRATARFGTADAREFELALRAPRAVLDAIARALEGEVQFSRPPQSFWPWQPSLSVAQEVRGLLWAIAVSVPGPGLGSLESEFQHCFMESVCWPAWREGAERVGAAGLLGSRAAPLPAPGAGGSDLRANGLSHHSSRLIRSEWRSEFRGPCFLRCRGAAD